jgi:glycosyltransferase involved in cell wall biosynthesis
MKILQVCHKPPYPPVEGGSIATYQLTMGLLENGYPVNVVAMNTHKQYCYIEQVPPEFVSSTNYQLVDVDIRIKPVDAFLNLFTTRSYNISRFNSQAFAKKLEQTLRTNVYDIIILESLYTTPYIQIIRGLSKALIVLRSHNIEHHIWKRLAHREKNILKKVYLNLLARRLKKYELKTLEEVDLIASISHADSDELIRLNCPTPSAYIPFGLQLSNEIYKNPPPIKINQPVLFHVGSMEWLPHQDAFKWFFEFVWPSFHQKNPDVELHLAGTHMPRWMVEKADDRIKITNGQVDGKIFMKDKDIMIVPSFSGSGIRIKIIEGMAMGKTIVTTKNGILGIPAKNGEHAYISDSPAKWVSTLSMLVQQPATIQSISINARQFAENHFNRMEVAQQFIQWVQKFLLNKAD